METHLYRASLFVLYQVSLLVAIVMLPIALLARRAGIRLPIHRVVTRLGDAYDSTANRA